MIDVNESVWPQPLLHLFPHDNGSGLLQNRQYLKRLAGQFQPQSPFAQFLRLKANFKPAKRITWLVPTCVIAPLP